MGPKKLAENEASGMNFLHAAQSGTNMYCRQFRALGMSRTESVQMGQSETLDVQDKNASERAKRAEKASCGRPKGCFWKVRFLPCPLGNLSNSVRTRCIVKGAAQKSPLFWSFLGLLNFLRSACSLGIPLENLKT